MPEKYKEDFRSMKRLNTILEGYPKLRKHPYAITQKKDLIQKVLKYAELEWREDYRSYDEEQLEELSQLVVKVWKRDNTPVNYLENIKTLNRIINGVPGFRKHLYAMLQQKERILKLLKYADFEWEEEYRNYDDEKIDELAKRIIKNYK
jgi:hypothetical protein